MTAHARIHTKPILDTPKPFVCSISHFGGFVTRKLLIAGEYYTVGEHTYTALLDGETPESLGLEPESHEEDEL